jgi:hypothetical protein
MYNVIIQYRPTVFIKYKKKDQRKAKQNNIARFLFLLLILSIKFMNI